MAELKIRIVVPEGVKFEETGSSVILPGQAGIFSVYPGHISLVTPLEHGSITIKKNDKTELVIATSGGMCEVEPDSIVLALRTAELKEEIDIERAKQAKERAEKRIVSGSEDIDMRRAEGALRRAINRINVAGNVSRY